MEVFADQRGSLWDVVGPTVSGATHLWNVLVGRHQAVRGGRRQADVGVGEEGDERVGLVQRRAGGRIPERMDRRRPDVRREARSPNTAAS
jgi:hypothetical protein